MANVNLFREIEKENEARRQIRSESGKVLVQGILSAFRVPAEIEKRRLAREDRQLRLQRENDKATREATKSVLTLGTQSLEKTGRPLSSAAIAALTAGTEAEEIFQTQVVQQQQQEQEEEEMAGIEGLLQAPGEQAIPTQETVGAQQLLAPPQAVVQPTQQIPGLPEQQPGAPLQPQPAPQPLQPIQPTGDPLQDAATEVEQTPLVDPTQGVIDTEVFGLGPRIPGFQTAAEKEIIKLNQKRFENTTGLRKEWNGNPVTKATREVRIQGQKLEAAAVQAISAKDPKERAAADVALVFSFMKMLDPGSVVRESEFKAAADTAGLFDRAALQLQKLQTGEKLIKEQRAAFLNLSRKFLQAQEEGQRKLNRWYVETAQRNGLDPRDIVQEFSRDRAKEDKFKLDIEALNNVLPSRSAIEALRKRKALRGKK